MRDVQDDILFFSGGTALNGTAGALAERGCNCAYIITTFDSGGSSAALRRAFDMPAVGDIRSRVLALADKTQAGVQELCAFFSYRLPAHSDAAHPLIPEEEAVPFPPALREAEQIALGVHPLLVGLSLEHKRLVREYTDFFFAEAPAGFSFAGASMGNLFMAAHYLRHERNLAAAAAMFSLLTHARGAVLPATERSAYLSVRTAAGEWIAGQHRFTGKPGSPYPLLASRVAEIRLTNHVPYGMQTSLDEPEPLDPPLSYTSELLLRIERAGAVCFPIGSFYSSVVAGLLPAGAGRAVAACKGPKLFVPNLGTDPELFGHTVRMQVERLLAALRLDLPSGAPKTAPKDVLSCILADEDAGRYPGGIPQAWLEKQGIRVTRFPLVTPRSAPLADPERLAEALLRCATVSG